MTRRQLKLWRERERERKRGGVKQYINLFREPSGNPSGTIEERWLVHISMLVIR